MFVVCVDAFVYGLGLAKLFLSFSPGFGRLVLGFCGPLFWLLFHEHTEL